MTKPHARAFASASREVGPGACTPGTQGGCGEHDTHGAAGGVGKLYGMATNVAASGGGVSKVAASDGAVSNGTVSNDGPINCTASGGAVRDATASDVAANIAEPKSGKASSGTASSGTASSGTASSGTASSGTASSCKASSGKASNIAARRLSGEGGLEFDGSGCTSARSEVLAESCERIVEAQETRLEPIGAGTMWVAAPYLEALARAGLLSFEAMMTTRSGRLLRALPDRENWWIELPDGAVGVRGAYLKKHHVRSWWWWLRAKLGLPPVQSPGRIEARNIARLAQAGVASMQLVAFGAKLHASGLLESFVLTEELAGYVQLDHFLRQRFTALHAGRPRSEERDLRALIGKVAAIARRFHDAGFNHRDFYCCHFFIREPSSGEFEVRLIDLQRVERRRRLRGRWLVKDLAQLAYSAPRDRLSCTHRLAFIKAYLGVRKLRQCDKRLIRRVLAKQHAMERHLGLHP